MFVKIPECKKLLLNREGVDGQVLDLDNVVKDGVLGGGGVGFGGGFAEKLDLKNMIQELNLSEIPSVFICPISLEPMEDPVTLCTGQTYERSNILKWFSLGRSVDIQFRPIG
ncbi:putative U box domain, Zinc finger, RING/FYVE/PHD-type [Helianthus annuus]|nr:putative U box domain, Zinc finger, RING/FYVE/PHD-type [Helianthus annuus]